MGNTYYGGDRVHGDKIVYSGRPRDRRAVVLLMGADPGPDRGLRIDEERREIDRVVGDRLVVRAADAVRLDDLQSALLRHRPSVVHFSGHGTESGGLVVNDERGRPKRVPPDALGDLFRILNDGLRCVVLNACWSESQARSIADHVPCVIGMSRAILDSAAIRFAAGFYEALAHGRSLRVAYDLGRNRLDLHRFPDAGVPRMIAAPGAADRPLAGSAVRD